MAKRYTPLKVIVGMFAEEKAMPEDPAWYMAMDVRIIQADRDLVGYSCVLEKFWYAACFKLYKT